jgi:hypothetical protein
LFVPNLVPPELRLAVFCSSYTFYKHCSRFIITFVIL